MSDAPECKKPKLSGDEFLQMKDGLRERKKILKVIPRIHLLSAGASASISVNVNPDDRIPIFLSDIQHLLLYSLLGHHSPYSPERWCKLEKFNRISHTVVFVVEGLSLGHYQLNESLFQHLSSKLDYKLELITPSIYGGSVVEELTGVPLSGTQKRKLIEKFGSLETAADKTENVIKLFKTIFPIQTVSRTGQAKAENVQLPSTDRFSRTELILSPMQLIEENYPIPLKGGLAKKYADYVLTKDEYIEVNSRSQMFGLDCEMCRTTTGLLELTRVSIVDEKLNVLYDTLVKPDNIITDYLTKYSGITKKMLEDVTTKLADVQKFIRALLPPNAILVGQSLNSDMQALKMMHPYIIDTSVIFNITGDRYRKTKLKVLAQTFLSEEIQKGKHGHCSTEDSLASMKLVQLKLANSIDFGDSVLIDQSAVNSYKYFRKNNVKLESELESTCTLGSLIFNHISKINKNAAIFGSKKVMDDYSRILKNSTLNIMDDTAFEKDDNIRLVIADSDKQAITRCAEVAMEHSLNFCHVKLDDKQLTEENSNKTLHSVDKWVKKLWEHTALHGLVCVIFSGEKNSTNGACFFNIKKMIDVEVNHEHESLQNSVSC